ncbi:MAG: hypothetical protein IJ759_04030 [Bacteroidales bacterium]|nr:hypothetical protein [Bacteroidales bacterium]
MRTKKIMAIMLLGAIFCGFFTANAQQQTKKWKFVAGMGVHLDALSVNKGWKPATGSRPGGFGAGLGFNLGARYDKLFIVFDADWAAASNYISSSASCELESALVGVKLGYDFLKLGNDKSKSRLTFLTGALIGANTLKYNFKSPVDEMTVLGARSLSANFNQTCLYVPLELRLSFDVGYVGLEYMLNVFRDDVSSGFNSTAKITDAPNINVLPLRLTFGFQF